jgi:hypothetical protein
VAEGKGHCERVSAMGFTGAQTKAPRRTSSSPHAKVRRSGDLHDTQRSGKDVDEKRGRQK